MITKSDLVLVTECFTFWDKLTNGEKQLLQDQMMIKSFKKEENIHNGENDCIGIFIVKKGTLRTYLLSEEGKEVTLYRMYRGDVCILSASCILQNITFDVYIDAEEDTELLLLNAGIFAQLSEQNVYVETFAYKLVIHRFSDVMWAMQQILFMSFDKRLAIFLIDEISKTGGDTILFTHEQIAKYIGSAREVVTRMLNYFSDEGIVALHRGSVKILDKAKLRKIVE